MRKRLQQLGVGYGILITISLLLNTAAWGIILWKLPYTEGTVFLHYNTYFGIDLTGDWSRLLWIPGSGTALLLVNVLIALFARAIDRFLNMIAICATVCMEAALLLASVLVVLLNR